MDNEGLINKLKIYEEENAKLKEQLEKYTHSQKEYYEKNKDIVKEKGKTYLHKLKEENPEKLKEYRSKIQNMKIENISNNENI